MSWKNHAVLASPMRQGAGIVKSAHDRLLTQRASCLKPGAEPCLENNVAALLFPPARPAVKAAPDL